jgi:hypothetical protein
MVESALPVAAASLASLPLAWNDRRDELRRMAQTQIEAIEAGGPVSATPEAKGL